MITFLTLFLNYHLVTFISRSTLVASQVRLLKSVDTDGEVPPEALVGEGFHPTLPRLQESNLPLRRQINQRCSSVLDPQHPVSSVEEGSMAG